LKSYKFNTHIDSEKEKYQNMMGFLNIAYKDYLASRTLFNSNQLYRAIIIANTCIEKYFKMFLAVVGNQSKTHDVSKLFKSIQNFDPKLGANINKEFIELISKAYKMRYIDDASLNSKHEEFNLVIERNKILAELDYTVSIIENSWTFHANGEILKNPYKNDMENNNPLLYENNYILNDFDKTAFIEQTEYVYEIRNDKNIGIIEVSYETNGQKNDGQFLREGLIKGQQN